MADNAKWYVAHTYSGYENAVKAAIEKSVVNRGMEDMVLKTAVHHGLFDGGLYRVFIAGIGMCYIPLCVISHVLYLRTDR